MRMRGAGAETETGSGSGAEEEEDDEEGEDDIAPYAIPAGESFHPIERGSRCPELLPSSDLVETASKESHNPEETDQDL